MEDFEGEMRYAEYQWFRVGNEDTNYALEVSGYSGSAGQYQWFLLRFCYIVQDSRNQVGSKKKRKKRKAFTETITWGLKYWSNPKYFQDKIWNICYKYTIQSLHKFITSIQYKPNVTAYKALLLINFVRLKATSLRLSPF